MCKVIETWQPVKDKNIFILYLDEETPFKPYWNYQIGGKVYKPVPMTFSKYDSALKSRKKCIAVEGAENFVGKEVKFI